MRSVIIAELRRTEVAGPGNFYEQFLRFLKNDTSQTVATAQIVPKICQCQPPHLAHKLFQISSKSVHYRRSYCRTRGDRFLPHRVFPI